VNGNVVAESGCQVDSRILGCPPQIRYQTLRSPSSESSRDHRNPLEESDESWIGRNPGIASSTTCRDWSFTTRTKPDDLGSQEKP
jgi:hypothetical protein